MENHLEFLQFISSLLKIIIHLYSRKLSIYDLILSLIPIENKKYDVNSAVVIKYIEDYKPDMIVLSVTKKVDSKI